MLAAGVVLGLMRGMQQDKQTQGKIASMQLQAGWEEDYGDQMLDQANTSSKRMKRVAYRNSIGIMNATSSKQMQIKAQSERVASSAIVQAAGRGADVGEGTPLENAALQMEAGDAMARTEQLNARGQVKSMWDDVKFKTDNMKKGAKFQRKMKYRKAALMREGAAGLQSSRGANMFSNILGGAVQGVSMQSQYDSTSGTGDSPSSGTGDGGVSVSSSSYSVPTKIHAGY